MTPQTILDMALRRAGLAYSNSTYRENAIEYANMTMAEILPHPWVFRWTHLVLLVGTLILAPIAHPRYI